MDRQTRNKWKARLGADGWDWVKWHQLTTAVEKIEAAWAYADRKTKAQLIVEVAISGGVDLERSTTSKHGSLQAVGKILLYLGDDASAVAVLQATALYYGYVHEGIEEEWDDGESYSSSDSEEHEDEETIEGVSWPPKIRAGDILVWCSGPHGRAGDSGKNMCHTQCLQVFLPTNESDNGNLILYSDASVDFSSPRTNKPVKVFRQGLDGNYKCILPEEFVKNSWDGFLGFHLYGFEQSKVDFNTCRADYQMIALFNAMPHLRIHEMCQDDVMSINAWTRKQNFLQELCGQLREEEVRNSIIHLGVQGILQGNTEFNESDLVELMAFIGRKDDECSRNLLFQLIRNKPSLVVANHRKEPLPLTPKQLPGGFIVSNNGDAWMSNLTMAQEPESSWNKHTAEEYVGVLLGWKSRLGFAIWDANIVEPKLTPRIDAQVERLSHLLNIPNHVDSSNVKGNVHTKKRKRD